MSNVFFREIGEHSTKCIDCSFCLWKEHDIANRLEAIKHYHVGDTVSVCFQNQHVLCDLIREFSERHVSSEAFIAIQCKVVERHQSMVFSKFGFMEPLSGVHVTLEAINLIEQDILKAVLIRERPRWIPFEVWIERFVDGKPAGEKTNDSETPNT